ncbi:unnamed protein product [Amoebophrya sp. A120]|nr:unnamed protein product [Amoebophrya sp. A120]|eukprot:GSA120T00017374001.1
MRRIIKQKWIDNFLDGVAELHDSQGGTPDTHITQQDLTEFDKHYGDGNGYVEWHEWKAAGGTPATWIGLGEENPDAHDGTARDFKSIDISKFHHPASISNPVGYIQAEYGMMEQQGDYTDPNYGNIPDDVWKFDPVQHSDYNGINGLYEDDKKFLHAAMIHHPGGDPNSVSMHELLSLCQDYKHGDGLTTQGLQNCALGMYGWELHGNNLFKLLNGMQIHHGDSNAGHLEWIGEDTLDNHPGNTLDGNEKSLSLQEIQEFPKTTDYTENMSGSSTLPAQGAPVGASDFPGFGGAGTTSSDSWC